MSAPCKTYRPEIDGLRAIAVIGVLLFHFGLGFPGGFVGVDVFFVISGYLITGILLRQLEGERFSLSDFWARRVRRIAPAAVVMALGTMAMGWYVLESGDFRSLARSLMAHVFFASNCYFSRDQGYFEESGEGEPLMHTWSLSVEEQFYFIFPLLLLFLWRKWGARSGVILAMLALISLAWSSWQVNADPKGAFFLLPARAWELLAGALLAFYRPSLRERPSLLFELITWLGLTLIMASMFLYDKATLFPGLSAIPPVLGAVLFMGGNAAGRTWAGRLLSVKPVVWIGLISYSLYLWHWPLVVYAHVMIIEMTLMVQASLIVLSFICAFLSWKFIEQPFRLGNSLAGKKKAYLFGGATMVVLWVLAFTIRTTEIPLREGVSERYYSETGSDPILLGVEGEGAPHFILWGDSHGAAAAHGLNQAAENLGLSGLGFLNDGTAPIPGLWFSDLSERRMVEKEKMKQVIEEKIIASGVKNLILMSRWVARCEGYSDAEMIGWQPNFRSISMVINEEFPKADLESSPRILVQHLEELALRLKQHGIQVIILHQVPETTSAKTEKLVFAQIQFPYFNHLPDRTTTLVQHHKRRARTDEAFALLPEGLIKIVDPTEAFFPNGEALKIYDQESYYLDDDHLTRAGSHYYLTPVFMEILQGM